MDIKSLDSINYLTGDLIDNMVIHSNLEELNSILSTHSFKKIEGSKDLPTMYLIEDAGQEKIHATATDLIRYNLRSALTPPTKTRIEFIDSNIMWDGVTGRSYNHRWITPVIDHGVIYFTGDIAWYNEPNIYGEPGNYIGTLIVSDPLMFSLYPMMKVIVDGTEYDGSVFTKYYDRKNQLMTSVMYNYLRILAPGQEIPITVIWDASHVEEFVINISPDSKLLSAVI